MRQVLYESGAWIAAPSDARVPPAITMSQLVWLNAKDSNPRTRTIDTTFIIIILGINYNKHASKNYVKNHILFDTKWQYKSITGKKLKTLICAVRPMNPERSLIRSLNRISNLTILFSIGLTKLLNIVLYILADSL